MYRPVIVDVLGLLGSRYCGGPRYHQQRNCSHPDQSLPHHALPLPLQMKGTGGSHPLRAGPACAYSSGRVACCHWRYWGVAAKYGSPTPAPNQPKAWSGTESWG